MPATGTPSKGPGPISDKCKSPARESTIYSDELSVLTLNLAHGRKDSFNQMLQKTSTTQNNLEEIAEFLGTSGADFIALQEADFPSRWSGNFNHVDFLSDRSPYPCRVHAHHAQKYMYDFGTALLSSVPYVESLTHTFAPSPPTTNKGFVMGQVHWNPGGQLSEPVIVSVISVHLDFSRRKVREAQISEMKTVLQGVSEPVIILGDFNTDWDAEDASLRTIADNGKFKVYQPEAVNLGTYKNGKHRLDWILISRDLEFVSYDVPQVLLSDHLPVQARIRFLEYPKHTKERQNTE